MRLIVHWVVKFTADGANTRWHVGNMLTSHLLTELTLLQALLDLLCMQARLGGNHLHLLVASVVEVFLLLNHMLTSILESGVWFKYIAVILAPHTHWRS